MSTDSELAAIADPRLDRHFLVPETKLAKLAAAADIQPTDHVIELGAGAGTVARALSRSASLTVFEYDSRLNGFLQQNVPHATSSMATPSIWCANCHATYWLQIFLIG